MEWSSAAKHFVGNSSLGVFDHFVGSGLRRLGCKHWDPLFFLLLSRLFCTFSAGRGGVPVYNLGQGCWGLLRGKGSISIFSKFCARVGEIFILGGRLGAKL